MYALLGVALALFAAWRYVVTGRSTHILGVAVGVLFAVGYPLSATRLPLWALLAVISLVVASTTYFLRHLRR